MRKSYKIILIIIAVLLLIAIIAYFIFAPKGTMYQDDDYHFSFLYPSVWEVSEKTSFDVQQVIFQQKGINTLSVSTPYRTLGSEVHAIEKTEIYETNDPETTISYQLYTPLHEGFGRIVVVSWQKGCNHHEDNSCFKENDPGVVLLMDLGDSQASEKYRLKQFNQVLESIKIL